MSLAIGLGGFIDGFEKGQRIRQDWADADQRKADIERKKVLQDREDVEYNRALDQRNALDKLATDTQADFDNKVQSGVLKPEDWGRFWNKSFIPGKVKQLQLNGQTEEAMKLQKWGDDENVRAGGNAFANSLQLFRMGDVDGGLEWLNKGANTPGYFGNGFGFEKVAEGTNPYTGNPGVVIRMTRPNGEPITQTFDVKDIPNFVAGNFNPEAAFSFSKQQEEQRKQASELDTYEKKKKIDQQYGVGPTKDRAAAIKSLRTRFNGGIGGDEQMFDDMPRPEQEKRINEELELQHGQPGLAGVAPPAPEKKVLFNNTTGKIEEARAAPASSSPTSKQDTPPVEEERSWIGSVITGIADRASDGLARERQRFRGQTPETADARSPGVSQEEALQQANGALEAGASTEEVASRLQQAGVPEWQWPAPVKEQLRARQRAYGLNP